MKAIILCFTLVLGVFSYSQTTVTGTVISENNEPIPGANVIIVGKTVGTVTDFDGKFVLNTAEELPFKINVSSIGFISSVISITKNNENVSVVLKESQTRLDEVVISASRTPERIFESQLL